MKDMKKTSQIQYRIYRLRGQQVREDLPLVVGGAPAGRVTRNRGCV